MEWMNISYVLAFLAVFVASVSQILLKQSAEIEHKNILFKFLNWRVILGYGLLFGTTDQCICIPRGRIEGDSHDRIHRYYLGHDSGSLLSWRTSDEAWTIVHRGNSSWNYCFFFINEHE